MNDLRLPQHERAYVGGGNIAGILGVSPFRTPLDEYHGILGSSPEIDADTREFFDRRKSLEPFAAHVLRRRGFVIQSQNVRYEDADVPLFRAEVDADLVLESGQLANGEFKSCHPMAAKDWGRDGDPEGAPMYVTAQGQWGMGINLREICFITAVIGFDESRVYPTPAAPDVIGMIRARAQAFLDNHVFPRIPPPPSTVEDILRYIEPNPAKAIEATDSAALEQDLQDLLVARVEEGEAEKRVTAIKTRIQLAMGNATLLTLNGRPAITWKQNKDSVGLDYKGAHELLLRMARLYDKPTADDVVLASTRTKPGNRVFLVKS